MPLKQDTVLRACPYRLGQPTPHTVWMINRFLNSKPPNDQRQLWLSELRAALEHPLSSQETRMAAERYLTYQKDNAHEG